MMTVTYASLNRTWPFHPSWMIYNYNYIHSWKSSSPGPKRCPDGTCKDWSEQAKWAGELRSEATKSQSQNCVDHQEGRTGSTVPPCSTSTAPSDLATDTPTLSCSSVSLETFSPTPSVLTGGSPFQVFFFFCLSLLSVVSFSNFSQPIIASVEAYLTKKKN